MKSLNCLVTGASSGIGRAISIELSKYVKHIYVNGRNIKKLEEVHDHIIKNHCKCTIVPLDLNTENGIENLAMQIFKQNNSLDILILSAGIIDHLSPVDSIDPNKLKGIIDINYFAAFKMIKYFHPLLKNSSNAKIGVISSIRENSNKLYWGIYQPVMTALNELILTYANENKNTDIKVTVFDPGVVNTKLRDFVAPGEDKNKISQPKEIASKVVNFVLNTKKTGEIIKI